MVNIGKSYPSILVATWTGVLAIHDAFQHAVRLIIYNLNNGINIQYMMCPQYIISII